MNEPLVLLILIIIVALAFDYVNGFHDSANAIATAVSTRALSPRQAVIMAGCLNVLGAFLSVSVAKTIGQGLVSAVEITQAVILCGLIGAIIWNLITWYFGLPASSSHALVGGLVGAVIAHGGFRLIYWKSILDKIILPALASPAIGLFFGFLFMLILVWTFRRALPQKVNNMFRKLQPFSCGFLALSHGMNDAQKTMGIIALALFSYGSISSFHIPFWVKLACAVVMGLGTAAGGWRIIKTLGSKTVKLTPVQGFAAEMASSFVLLATGHMGFPVSTTHVITASIMGAGATQRLSAVRWGVANTILTAWVLTIPAAAFMGWFCFRIIGVLF